MSFGDSLTPLPEVQRGVYRHYKGMRYRVIGVARHSESYEPLVVYQALYGDHALWARPHPMFFEVDVFAGLRQPRFVLESAD